MRPVLKIYETIANLVGRSHKVAVKINIVAYCRTLHIRYRRGLHHTLLRKASDINVVEHQNPAVGIRHVAYRHALSAGRNSIGIFHPISERSKAFRHPYKIIFLRLVNHRIAHAEIVGHSLSLSRRACIETELEVVGVRQFRRNQPIVVLHQSSKTCEILISAVRGEHRVFRKRHVWICCLGSRRIEHHKRHIVAIAFERSVIESPSGLSVKIPIFPTGLARRIDCKVLVVLEVVEYHGRSVPCEQRRLDILVIVLYGKVNRIRYDFLQKICLSGVAVLNREIHDFANRLITFQSYCHIILVLHKGREQSATIFIDSHIVGILIYLSGHRDKRTFSALALAVRLDIYSHLGVHMVAHKLRHRSFRHRAVRIYGTHSVCINTVGQIGRSICKFGSLRILFHQSPSIRSGNLTFRQSVNIVFAEIRHHRAFLHFAFLTAIVGKTLASSAYHHILRHSLFFNIVEVTI